MNRWIFAFAFVLAAAAATLWAHHVIPQPIDNGTTCQDLGYYSSVVVDPAIPGTFTVEQQYEATVALPDDYTLGWIADKPLPAVLVFGPPGHGGFHYAYPGFATYSDAGLYAPNLRKIKSYALCNDLR